MQAAQPRQALRRKGNTGAPAAAAAAAPAATLANEPTLVLENGMSASQLYQQAAADAFAGRADRPRARIVVPAAQMEEALQLTTQGKVTAKNAWTVPLIEGMVDELGHCLEDDADQYVQFTKAAHLVEGGAKVWTHRVDSAYLLSTQMVKRLLRNDARDDGDGDDDDDSQAGNKDDAKPRRKRKALERTLADRMEEINAEGAHSLVGCHVNVAHHEQHMRRGDAADQPTAPNTGAKGALAAHGALFRAVTEKFDQGHAQGLLLNNTRSGAMGNLVLDRDFAAAGDGAAVVPEAPEDIDVPVFHLSSGAAVAADDLQQAQHRLADEAQAASPLAPEVDADDTVAGFRSVNASRAASVFSAAARGDFSDDDNDAGGGWDDGPASDDDGQGQWGEDEASRLARAAVRGDEELNAIDEHFSAAMRPGGGAVPALSLEDPSSWVPLSQQVTQRLRRSGVLATIRGGVVARAKAANTEEVQAAKKARRERKAVKFIGAAVGEEEIDFGAEALVPQMEPLMDPKKLQQSLTPLGKRVTSGQENPVSYTAYDFALKRAQAANLLLPEQQRQPLPEWSGAEVSNHTHSVEDFFQLFVAQAPHWNLLRKTVKAEALEATGASAGAAGNRALPVMDAEQAGMFDDDDYAGDWGPDDDDDPWPAANVLAAVEEDAELPAVDDAEALDLIPEPEQLRALKVQMATAPTMVDVVKLRSTMWRRAAALSRRAAGEAAGRSSAKLEAEAAHQSAAASAPAPPSGRTMFSDVITSMLPEVPSIARDGTLSPAFFFFSLLFLANEHNLDLRQVVGPDELERATAGEDPAVGANGGFDNDDDDTPLAARFATGTTAMRRAHEDHVGGKVERVGCDVVIRVPGQPTKTE